MIGITSFGAYIPFYRLDRDLIAKAWGRSSLKGERSVANNDEDSITMGVEAGSDCLKGLDRKEIKNIFFATTTAPYREKLSAGLIGTVLDLERDIFSADFGNSLRAATGALRAALDSVKAGSSGKTLVVAGDCRLAYPRSDNEQWFGDGAAAVLIGKDRAIATIVSSVSINNEIVDIWRTDGDKYVRAGESRFILNEGYLAVMEETLRKVLAESNIAPTAITKVLIPSPDYRSCAQVASKVGFNPETQLADPMLASVGHCGVAHPLMLLVSALENSKPGDTLLMASYGDGGDAFIFRVTEEVLKLAPRRGICKYLKSKSSLPSYNRFLSYKGELETAPGEPFRLFPSAAAYWRDQHSILRCHGSRCKKCGKSIFPIHRVCLSCRSKDEYEEVRYAEHIGKVVSYTIDQLAGRSDDPVVVQTVFDMEDGARFYLMMTDCDSRTVKGGLPVELTFRKIHEGADFHNYFWKCRPLRDGGELS